MAQLRIAIIGNGRMGSAIARLAEDRGHVIHTVINRAENPGGRALTRERLSAVDVALEFTRPDAAVANLERLIELGVPTVTGTTGWTEELPRVTQLVQSKGTALLHAANFAVGVHLFFQTARELARRFRRRSEFAESIHEEHHAAKVDSPSGTALLLQRKLKGEEPGREFPISSVRSGDTPGTHTLIYEGPFETISLSHVTRSRQVFAAGALAAAEWLPGRTGVFTFDDMLFGASA